jgi:uncharacterized protein YcgL (UPF0745 family)
MNKMPCVVYKSLQQFDYYLFVERKNDFSRVPDSLMCLLGELQAVISLELDKKSKLARADVSEVMCMLKEQGYYLQMPPGRGEAPDA